MQVSMYLPLGQCEGLVYVVAVGSAGAAAHRSHREGGNGGRRCVGMLAPRSPEESVVAILWPVG